MSRFCHEIYLKCRSVWVHSVLIGANTCSLPTSPYSNRNGVLVVRNKVIPRIGKYRGFVFSCSVVFMNENRKIGNLVMLQLFVYSLCYVSTWYYGRSRERAKIIIKKTCNLAINFSTQFIFVESVAICVCCIYEILVSFPVNVHL